MQKNSFTLIETLVSITLLLIVIIGFKYSTYYDGNSSKNFMLLNNLENLFDTKNYGSFQNSTKTLQLIKNKEIIENITVTKYQFENENIKLFKYEK
ncbi:type IV pilus modification PilV family protein [Aliarcobacter butzleri]|uniref:type IV pilus modification PilV family protein n=1 Tax=Aliarcobacter butzleri TaxID=28197 RepID=UPI00125FE7E6|nr:prepilin-type N-terminal cleavage/methylation domain-containing protein [Aliarcobacter butzleri]MCP3648473.1 prepilin-type N-terminal cleavage/methylation domain-containing protein [Arcobacter sp. DNRA7]MCR1814646.1 prepilin-type N-terminal cleavage/methylation domain-containing protein [Aliarcobacter butzleri]MCT7568592.1 prepilin-type N-terminal cleavage/methylation domain-containing protein [Aliarcobacter butzleri]MDY0192816.1 prepilin-type N-terminal cleavage/methylation domain-containin